MSVTVQYTEGLLEIPNDFPSTLDAFANGLETTTSRRKPASISTEERCGWI